MSDSGTDSFVGVTAVLIVAVAVFAAASGNPLVTSSPAPAPTETTRAVSSTRPVRTPPAGSTTNIPGGTLLGCAGEVLSNETVASRGSAINLRVYYQRGEGGRNCAVATKIGRSRGQVVINLRLTGSDSRDWPQFAEDRSSAAATRSGSVYLDGTDNRCVRAEARFIPADGKPVTVSSGRIGCD